MDCYIYKLFSYMHNKYVLIVLRSIINRFFNSVCMSEINNTEKRTTKSTRCSFFNLIFCKTIYVLTTTFT